MSCAMPNIVLCHVFGCAGRVFVDVHPLQTGRGLVSRRRPAAAGSMSHSHTHVCLVRVQDEALHGCEAQIATLCRTIPLRGCDAYKRSVAMCRTKPCAAAIIFIG